MYAHGHLPQYTYPETSATHGDRLWESPARSHLLLIQTDFSHEKRIRSSHNADVLVRPCASVYLLRSLFQVNVVRRTIGSTKLEQSREWLPVMIKAFLSLYFPR